MNQSEKKYYYFQPGEMLFLISHDSDRRMDLQINEDGSNSPVNSQDQPDKRDPVFDEIIEAGLLEKITNIVQDPNLRITRLKDRELHFPGTLNLEVPRYEVITTPSDGKYEPPKPEQRGAFSIIPVDVSFSNDLNDQANLEGQEIFDQLANLIKILEEARLELEANMNERRGNRPLIKLVVVSPNWLSSPCDEWTGGGGPGARPVPYTHESDPVPYEFKFIANVTDLFPEDDKRGEGVRVAILDTAPCLHDLAEAYERYHKVDPRNQPAENHPLIERLLGPNGRLHVHPASLDDLIRLRAVYLKDHDYKMTDHGLFVAGIINTIAPAAELHLYEVLNPQGVGDLVSIAGGLLKVAEEQYNSFINDPETLRPLVVNCSLMLNIPLHGDVNNPDAARPLPPVRGKKIVGHRLMDLNQAILNIIAGDPAWVERAGEIIMRICDLLYFCRSRVIAAAGNDWQPDEEDRPEARYPAAFESVLGVGALPRGKIKTNEGRRMTSRFSNLSDAPSRIGVATLGGEPGNKKGVLGVYLGEFPPEQGASPGNPPGQGYKKDWAWWAGTSFATPIVTAAIAAVLSGTHRPERTEDAVALLYEKGVIEDDQTEYKEDLLEVVQE